MTAALVSAVRSSMRFARRLRRLLFRVQSHVVFAADCTNAKAVEWPPYEMPVRFSRASPLQADLREALLQRLPSSREYLTAVEQGEAEGLLVCVDGVIVHSAYLMFRNKTVCLLGFDRTFGLLGNSYTAQSYRRRGCQSRSVRERLAMARQAGLNHAISETAPDNTASQRGLSNGGMNRVGCTHFAVALNMVVLRFTRAARSATRMSLCL